MKRKKWETPTIYHFIAAAASDRDTATRMLGARPEWLNERTSLGETALHYLVVESDVPAVKFLLDKGAGADTESHFQTTPLMSAAQVGHAEICKLLIAKGANVNAKDELDYTPLHHAAQSGKAEILEALIAAGVWADTHGEYEPSVLDVALPRKRAQIVEVLKKHGYT